MLRLEFLRLIVCCDGDGVCFNVFVVFLSFVYSFFFVFLGLRVFSMLFVYFLGVGDDDVLMIGDGELVFDEVGFLGFGF